MGIGGGFAAHGAQAEALGFIEACRFQLAVVPDQAFGLALLDEKLAVLGALQRICDEGFGLRAAEVGGVEERNGGAGAHGGHLWIRSVSAQDR